MKQTTGKGKQWLMVPVVLLFLWACGSGKMLFFAGNAEKGAMA